MEKQRIFNKLLFALVMIVILTYLFSIFTINITGRGYINFDIYSDAILAKYMAQEQSLFPEGWHFGNQIYTVATPAVASLFYPITNDAYLALALASCCMTILCVVSFLWCIMPFAKPKSILIGLLVLIGGTNIGLTAHGDLEGLQVFYTMASYYACYVIGIFVTLGVYFRYLKRVSVGKPFLLIVLALNLALGMQSLREMLVLNLPLSAIAALTVMLHVLKEKKVPSECKNAFLFASAALLANLAGIMISKFLAASGIILQSDILQAVRPRLIDNITAAFQAFLQYIDLSVPTGLFSAFKTSVALFSVIIVLIAQAFVAYDLKNGRASNTAYGILFFVMSLIAVFMAGLFFISLRSIYYFCWYLLLSFCVIFLMDLEWSNYRKLLDYLKSLLLISLLCISVLNYTYTFVPSFKGLGKTRVFYNEIVNQLQADGIQYVYADWRTEQDMIAAISKDDVVYATVSFSNDPIDLWNPIDYLYMDSWFDAENFSDAYIVLSDTTFTILDNEFSPEYKEALLESLTLVHEFSNDGDSVYFYSGTPKLYYDMIR